MAGLGLVGFDAEHVGAVGTAAYPAEITPSGAYRGGHHDCASFDVGIDGDEVSAVIRKKIFWFALKIIVLEMVNSDRK